MRFADHRHGVGQHRTKSAARRIADNGARARKALPNLLAHGARPGLFGAQAKLLCFRLKWGLAGLWTGLTVSLILIALVLIARWLVDSRKPLALQAPN